MTYLRKLYRGILRDYLAAHAPESIKDSYPRIVSPLPQQPKPPKEIEERAREWLDDPCYDFAECFKSYAGQEREERELWPEKHYALATFFEALMRDYWDKKRQIEAQDALRNLVAWRYVYADAMLAEREKAGGAA